MFCSDYFSKLLDIVYAHHGDVIKFCGDAVMILWSTGVSSDGNNGNNASEQKNFDAVKAATAFCASLCALELIQECGHYVVQLGTDTSVDDALLVNESAESGPPDATYELSLHCGIASGIVHCLCLGSGGDDIKTENIDQPSMTQRQTQTQHQTNSRWEYLLSGKILQEVGVATSHASSGEINVTVSSYNLLSKCLEMSPVLATKKDGTDHTNICCYQLTGNLNSKNTGMVLTLELPLMSIILVLQRTAVSFIHLIQSIVQV